MTNDGAWLILLSSPISRNISLLSHTKSSLYSPPSPPSQRGVSRSSRTLGGDAVDAGGALTRAQDRGRRSRVVLMPRRWHQARDDAPHHTDDGGKQARSPGRARRKPLKPLRGECRTFPGVTVVTNACAFYQHTRGCGRAERPAFPAPSIFEGERIQQSSGASRRGDAAVCLSLRGAIATKQSTLSLRRDGLLRFARNDGGGYRGCLKIQSVRPSPSSSAKADDPVFHRRHG
jgi:hypothetical protein